MTAPNWAIIVTGGRDFEDVAAVKQVLSTYPPGTVVIHGDCLTGADAIADRIARDMGHVVLPMSCKRRWDDKGKKAGPIRNALMVSVLCALRWCGYAVCVEAFPTKRSRGTINTMRVAKQRHVRTNVHAPSGEDQEKRT